MRAFIIRRAMWTIVVLLVVTMITFFLMHMVPGGPFSSEKALPESTIEQLNAKYHLDEPLVVQYLKYVQDILIPVVMTGHQQKMLDHEYLINIKLPVGNNATLRWVNFGPSYKSISRPVNDIFRENLPVSAQLGVLSVLMASAIGIPLGVLAGMKRNTVYDYAGMGIAVLGVSVPVIVIAPLLQYVFGVWLRVLPVTGWGEPKQMILPTLALGFS